ncbi:MAG: hypothetical protein AB1633_12765, partial [Elusimicrobiota bacterium]
IDSIEIVIPCFDSISYNELKGKLLLTPLYRWHSKTGDSAITERLEITDSISFDSDSFIKINQGFTFEIVPRLSDLDTVFKGAFNLKDSSLWNENLSDSLSVISKDTTHVFDTSFSLYSGKGKAFIHINILDTLFDSLLVKDSSNALILSHIDTFYYYRSFFETYVNLKNESLYQSHSCWRRKEIPSLIKPAPSYWDTLFYQDSSLASMIDIVILDSLNSADDSIVKTRTDMGFSIKISCDTLNIGNISNTILNSIRANLNLLGPAQAVAGFGLELTAPQDQIYRVNAPGVRMIVYFSPESKIEGYNLLEVMDLACDNSGFRISATHSEFNAKRDSSAFTGNFFRCISHFKMSYEYIEALFAGHSQDSVIPFSAFATFTVKNDTFLVENNPSYIDNSTSFSFYAITKDGVKFMLDVDSINTLRQPMTIEVNCSDIFQRHFIEPSNRFLGKSSDTLSMFIEMSLWESKNIKMFHFDKNVKFNVHYSILGKLR